MSIDVWLNVKTFTIFFLYEVNVYCIETHLFR